MSPSLVEKTEAPTDSGKISGGFTVHQVMQAPNGQDSEGSPVTIVKDPIVP